ncbi:MAG: hypothetical protein LUF35_12150 [Lachnospiraceae bacterium]|nr:hypothetical protein [Lachnospiraceae bacterium]
MDNNVTSSPSDELLVNRNIKDSVFRNLFSDKKYLFQLYQALHPEDKETATDDLEYVTLENVLVRDIYNDLGVRIGHKYYLTSREKEVVDIMITLFDQQEVLEDYIASERREEAEMSAQRTAKKMYAKHISIEDIADVVGYSVKTVEKWLGLVPQV